MKEPAIIFDNVSKSYPLYYHLQGGIKYFLFNLPKGLSALRNTRFEAVRNISFEVLRGETFGIIGRNGVGKSTILGLIAGVLKPTTGKIIAKGRITPLLELGAGFQPELSGWENIILNGILLGLTKKEVLKKMGQIVEFSELREFIYQPIRTYSGGMLARLGFSVVAHLDPEILLIDEILSVGDDKFQKKCLDKMMDFKKSGITIIFVSHVLADIQKMCDRVAWVGEHSIKSIGDPTEVIKAYLS